MVCTRLGKDPLRIAERGNDSVSAGKTSFEFYERYHRDPRPHPIEQLKQRRRIEALSALMPPETPRTLFVGCGRGNELEIARGRVLAFDVAITALREAAVCHPHAVLSKADARFLPYADRSFECVICSEVIEHIEQADRVLAEIHRVLTDDGCLVLSTPNWLSFFGLARRVGEWLTREQITSGGQPYDRWATPASLRRLLRGSFDVRRWLGSWYFPPFGRGKRQLPSRLTVPFVKLCMPIERVLERRLPWFGHIILVLASKRVGRVVEES